MKGDRKLCKQYIGIPILFHWKQLNLEYVIHDVSNGLVRCTYRVSNSKFPGVTLPGKTDDHHMASIIRSTLKREK